jgi:hypothetical protein
MKDFAEFCGFFAAHGVWQLEGGESVVPILALQKAGERGLERFAADEYEKAVEAAHTRLAEARTQSDHQVLVFDGYFTDEHTRSEALFVEGHTQPGGHEPALMVAIPYRRFPDGLLVSDVQVLQRPEGDLNEFMDAFFAGAKSHQEGWAFWSQHQSPAD